jgi:hypothetical protein
MGSFNGVSRSETRKCVARYVARYSASATIGQACRERSAKSIRRGRSAKSIRRERSAKSTRRGRRRIG